MIGIYAAKFRSSGTRECDAGEIWPLEVPSVDTGLYLAAGAEATLATMV